MRKADEVLTWVLQIKHYDVDFQWKIKLMSEMKATKKEYMREELDLEQVKFEMSQDNF